ncbi:MAG TPA: AMP-binding protein [Solirubrobacteraceae bacterium]|jgi:long-chain acyl-CoA synthetase|nr:AMP-binding protein [Solirubrobacteraceae bacterium]
MGADGGVIISSERTLGREELMDRAARAASGLLGSGGRAGGAVAILLRNDFAFLETVFAAGSIGAQAVPVNWHFKAAEINFILEDSGATHLIAHADLLRELDGRLPSGLEVLSVPTPPEVAAAYAIDAAECGPVPGVAEWAAFLERHPPLPREEQRKGGTMMYTSGTTGRPKGVRRQALDPRRHRLDAELRQLWFGNRPGMSTAIVGPMYHSVQLSYTTAAVQAPGRVLLVPRFDAEQLLAVIEAEHLTHLHLVPIMMSRLVKLPREVRERYDTSSLEFVVHGSAPCPPEVKGKLIDWLGPIVHEYYGTTEAGMVSRASSEEWRERPGTVGRAWPGREVRICDDEGRLLARGEPGEVYMSLGPMPDFTYQNADAERAEIERDGLVTSGDIGYLDEDGYLYLCDRKRDLVISGGVNIYPAEIEGVLAAHPAVLDSAVFAVPDDDYGERAMAAVQLREDADADPEELRQFLRARLAGFKVPRVIEIRDALPREPSGKIAKRRLRDPYWAHAGRMI